MTILTMFKILLYKFYIHRLRS